MVVEFFDPLMDQTIAMLEEARAYVAEEGPRERMDLSVEVGLSASVESMRVVSRLTQVMAWILTQRAVLHGEMTADEAKEPQQRLGGLELCMNNGAAADRRLPAKLRSLLTRSYELYCRVERLDRTHNDRQPAPFTREQ
ncbi:MAG TPA: DUF1465 family protein [Dongiaceae bacterium]|jgi:regulator of CtrA degradation|nr:DUF1465 family protein [Dongiaceae bacterium]